MVINHKIETDRGVVLSEDGSFDYDKCEVKVCRYENDKIEKSVMILSSMDFSSECQDAVDIVNNLDLEYVLYGVTGVLSKLAFLEAICEYNDCKVAEIRNNLKKFR